MNSLENMLKVRLRSLGFDLPADFDATISESVKNLKEVADNPNGFAPGTYEMVVDAELDNLAMKLGIQMHQTAKVEDKALAMGLLEGGIRTAILFLTGGVA